MRANDDGKKGTATQSSAARALSRKPAIGRPLYQRSL